MNTAKNSEQQIEVERMSPVGGFTTSMAQIIDLLVSGFPISLCAHLIQLFWLWPSDGISFQPSDGIAFYLIAFLFLIPFLYALLARRGKVFSVGLWSNGLKRVEHLDDEGRVRVSYVREGCSPQTLSRRAIGVAAYLAAIMLVVYVIAP